MGPYAWLLLFVIVTGAALFVNLVMTHEVRPSLKAACYLVVGWVLVGFVILPRLSGGWATLIVVLFLVYCLVVVLATVDLPDWGFIARFKQSIWEDWGSTARIRVVRRWLAALIAISGLVCGVIWFGQLFGGPSSVEGSPGTSTTPPASIGSSAAPTTTQTTTPPSPQCEGVPELTTISPQVEVPFDPKGVERCTDGKWVAVSSTELPAKVKPVSRGERDGRKHFKLDSGLLIRGPAQN